MAPTGPETLALSVTVPLKPLLADAVTVADAVWPGATLEVTALFPMLKPAGFPPPEAELHFPARLATFIDPSPEALSNPAPAAYSSEPVP